MRMQNSYLTISSLSIGYLVVSNLKHRHLLRRGRLHLLRHDKGRSLRRNTPRVRYQCELGMV